MYVVGVWTGSEVRIWRPRLEVEDGSWYMYNQRCYKFVAHYNITVISYIIVFFYPIDEICSTRASTTFFPSPS